MRLTRPGGCRLLLRLSLSAGSSAIASLRMGGSFSARGSVSGLRGFHSIAMRARSSGSRQKGRTTAAATRREKRSFMKNTGAQAMPRTLGGDGDDCMQERRRQSTLMAANAVAFPPIFDALHRDGAPGSALHCAASRLSQHAQPGLIFLSWPFPCPIHRQPRRRRTGSISIITAGCSAACCASSAAAPTLPI